MGEGGERLKQTSSGDDGGASVGKGFIEEDHVNEVERNGVGLGVLLVGALG